LNRRRRYPQVGNNDKNPVILYIFGIAALVVADQLTKLWVLDYLKKIGSMNVFGDFLKFTYETNIGAAFSTFQGQRVIIIAVPLIMIAVCLFFLISRRLNSVLGDVSLMFIIAGGVGNLIDRVMRGYVVDFIYFAKINFAVFNVADSCVTIGAVLLIIFVLMHEGNFGGRKSRIEIFKKRRRY
jgi:signal peptidase II